MKIITWIGVAMLFAATTAPADVKETEEMTYEVKPGARISVENINGEIHVTGGGDRVRVLAHKKADKQEDLDKLKVIVDASEDYVRIETRHPKQESRWLNWGDGDSGSVSYELTVPADVALDAIETVNGDVRIEKVSGTVKAGTVNGGLEITNLVGDVHLETVNGSIEAEFDKLDGDQRVDAETVNGKIVLRVPANTSARVTAETVNGSIDADDFGLEPEKGFVGRDLSGEIGDGAARVSLDTVNGSIRIDKR